MNVCFYSHHQQQPRTHPPPVDHLQFGLGSVKLDPEEGHDWESEEDWVVQHKLPNYDRATERSWGVPMNRVKEKVSEAELEQADVTYDLST